MSGLWTPNGSGNSSKQEEPDDGEVITTRRRMRLFLAKFKISEECWEWEAGVSDSTEGYGSFWMGERAARAHRVSYSTFVAPIPSGREIHHHCMNKLCIRPDHLEPVTPAENMSKEDGVIAIAKRKRALTHCKHGHEFTDENTYIYRKNGRRACRACKRRLARKYRRRAKEGSET